jgi:hypothetical protein
MALLNYQRRLKLNAALILLLSLAFPAIPAYFAYEGQGFTSHTHFSADVVLFIGLILGAGTLVALWFHHEHQWTELFRELVYIFWQGKYACFLAIGVGLIAAYVYVALPFDPKNNEFAERAASAFAVYIGVFGSIIGIHTLYRKSAPITKVETLLESLANDLDEYGTPGNRLLFVYPALNIGHYRALVEYEKKGDVPTNHPYRRFSKKLIEKAYDSEATILIVTYPATLYKPLFDAYDSGKEQASSSRVERCVAEARKLVETCSAAAGADSLVFVSPDHSPPHVVVIGPVSYSILSYGLPRYRKEGEEEYFESNNNSLANLLVHRREDPALAGVIFDEVEKELKRLRAQHLI